MLNFLFHLCEQLFSLSLIFLEHIKLFPHLIKTLLSPEGGKINSVASRLFNLCKIAFSDQTDIVIPALYLDYLIPLLMELMAASLKLSLPSKLDMELLLMDPVIRDILCSLEVCIKLCARWSGSAC